MSRLYYRNRREDRKAKSVVFALLGKDYRQNSCEHVALTASMVKCSRYGLTLFLVHNDKGRSMYQLPELKSSAAPLFEQFDSLRGRL